MFNVKIIKAKDIVRYFLKIVLTIIFVICISKWLNETNEKIKLNQIKIGSLTNCLEEIIPAISNTKKYSIENKVISTDKKYFKQLISTQISSIEGLEKLENKKENKILNKEEKQKENEIILANAKKTETEVVTENPLSGAYNSQYKDVKIKNETTYDLTEDMLNPDIEIDNKNIIIFHTHSCESYTPSEKYEYEQTGNYRTTDLNYTVTRVGTELTEYLKKYNINVNHDMSYHDYPSYNGSYSNSLETVENMLKTESADIIIDLHRDAVGSRSDYAPTVKIGNDYAAQLMFVIGTNEGGLFHPNWNQNLKFAIKVQQKAEEMYPGLFKPMTLTKSRYNQHTGKYANIIEVGATGNTLEQALTSMRYLSAVLNSVINEK